MSVEEWYASECKICNGYSNSGFDLCEECAMKFALWFAINHKKDLDKLLKTKLILDNEDGLWSYSKVSSFMNKEYERFRKLNQQEGFWYDKLLKGVKEK